MPLLLPNPCCLPLRTGVLLLSAVTMAFLCLTFGAILFNSVVGRPYGLGNLAYLAYYQWITNKGHNETLTVDMSSEYAVWSLPLAIQVLNYIVLAFEFVAIICLIHGTRYEIKPMIYFWFVTIVFVVGYETAEYIYKVITFAFIDGWISGMASAFYGLFVLLRCYFLWVVLAFIQEIKIKEMEMEAEAQLKQPVTAVPYHDIVSVPASSSQLGSSSALHSQYSMSPGFSPTGSNVHSYDNIRRDTTAHVLVQPPPEQPSNNIHRGPTAHTFVQPSAPPPSNNIRRDPTAHTFVQPSAAPPSNNIRHDPTGLTFGQPPPSAASAPTLPAAASMTSVDSTSEN